MHPEVQPMGSAHRTIKAPLQSDGSCRSPRRRIGRRLSTIGQQDRQNVKAAREYSRANLENGAFKPLLRAFMGELLLVQNWSRQQFFLVEGQY
jgi:hypothetical protein